MQATPPPESRGRLVSFFQLAVTIGILAGVYGTVAHPGLGLPVVRAYMKHVQDNAEESVRRVITRLKDGAFTLPLTAQSSTRLHEKPTE